MNKERLSELSNRFSVAIPDDYSSFVTNYPESDSMTADIQDFDVYSRYEDILRVNDEVRGNDVSEWMPGGWPSHFFAIGESGCGDYYCIDTSKNPAPVICWNHEIADFEVTAVSTKHFYEHLVADE